LKNDEIKQIQEKKNEFEEEKEESKSRISTAKSTVS